MYQYAFSVLCEIPYLKAGDDLTVGKKNLILQMGFVFTHAGKKVIRLTRKTF